MNDVISDYQKWKQQGDSLRAQAKQAMESRFHVLLTEAAQIAAEYRSDFGSPLKPLPPVTAFRYKALSKSKAKKKAGKRETVSKAVREVPQSQSGPREGESENYRTAETIGDCEEETGSVANG